MDPIISKYALYAVAGGIGALIKTLLEKDHLMLPKYDKETGKLYLGFLTGVIIGIVAGIIVDQHPITAFTAGFGGPHLFEQMQRKYNDYKNNKENGTTPK